MWCALSVVMTPVTGSTRLRSRATVDSGDTVRCPAIRRELLRRRPELERFRHLARVEIRIAARGALRPARHDVTVRLERHRVDDGDGRRRRRRRREALAPIVRWRVRSASPPSTERHRSARSARARVVARETSARRRCARACGACIPSTGHVPGETTDRSMLAFRPCAPTTRAAARSARVDSTQRAPGRDSRRRVAARLRHRRRRRIRTPRAPTPTRRSRHRRS